MGNDHPVRPSALAAEWVPDSTRVSCTYCNSAFTTINRKHHCRCCGNLLCHSCCNHFIPLPRYGYETPVRTCSKCVEKIQKLEHTEPPMPKPTKQDLQEGIKKYTIAIEENCNDIASYLERAKLYEQVRHYASALEDYNKIIDDFGVTEPDVYLLRADLVFRANQDTKTALADLDAAIGVDDKFIPAYILRAKVHEFKNEVPKAITDIATALAINPNNIDALLARAKLFDSKLNDTKQFMDDVDKVIELDPKNSEAYLLKGVCLDLKFGQHAKAIQVFNDGLLASPHCANLYVERAKLCKFKLNDETLALDDYNKAVSLNPELANDKELQILFGK